MCLCALVFGERDEEQLSLGIYHYSNKKTNDQLS